VLTALLHFALAIIVVPLATAACFFSFRSLASLFISYKTLSPHWALTLPFFPLQSTSGFLTAFWLALRGGRFGQSRTAQFVWVIPVAWFLVFYLAWNPHSVLTESRWDHFFWSGTSGSKNEQLVTTLPFLTSFAYALGNHVGRKCQHNGETAP